MIRVGSFTATAHAVKDGGKWRPAVILYQSSTGPATLVFHESYEKEAQAFDLAVDFITMASTNIKVALEGMAVAHNGRITEVTPPKKPPVE